MFPIEDDVENLLPETRYQYPAHITGVQVSAQDVPGKMQPARLPSRDSGLTKSNETTPALQSYLSTLQQRQKHFINQQIRKEKEQQGETDTYTNASGSAPDLNNAKKDHNAGLKLFKMDDLPKQTNADSGRADDGFLFNIKKKRF
jgi:hypothetical protein